MSMGREWSHKVNFKVLGIDRRIFVFVASLITSLAAVEDIGPIGCDATLEQVLKIQKTDCDEVSLQCPTSCHVAVCRVTGSNPYTDASSVCCAAIHGGILSLEKKSITIQISRKPKHLFFGTTRNGIKSKAYLRTAFLWFEFEDVTLTTQSVTTSTPMTSTTNTQPFKTNKIADTTTTTILPEEITKTTSNNFAQDEINLLTLKHQIETSTKVTMKRLYNTTKSSRLPDGIKYEYSEMPQLLDATSVDVPNFGKQHILGLNSEIEMACLLIGVFIGGILFTLLLLCIVKKKKRMQQWRARRSCAGGNSNKKQKKKSHRFEDGDVCVCYQNLNSSKQGLLYDPETCDRPCPIRKPMSEEESILRENSLVHNKPLEYDHDIAYSNDKAIEEKSSDSKGAPNKSFKRNSKCVHIAYEDECAASCSGTCNPQQYDF